MVSGVFRNPRCPYLCVTGRGSVNSMTQRTKEDSPTALRTLCLCAERELSAFARAVEGLFGPEQAQQSIEDWMEELESPVGQAKCEVVSKQPAKK